MSGGLVARDGQRARDDGRGRSGRGPAAHGAMNGWAILALGTAIVSAMLALVPAIGFVMAVPGGAVASLLAFPALSRSERTGTGRSMAWSALVLGLVAMFLSYSLALLSRAA